MAGTINLLNFIYLIIFISQLIKNQLILAAIGECNFEKYATGCFSQANFVCDPDTNFCKCHPDSPILIEQRLCVKRAKFNEICQYNEQCDNSNNYYCLYNDFKFVNNSLSVRDTREVSRCKNIKSRQKYKHNQQSANTISSSSSSMQEKQQSSRFKNQHNHNFHLPRLVWFILLSCLFGLVLLLFLIRNQYLRIGRSFQQQEDRQSINSDQDVPPPYDIAIRMKL